MSKPPVTVMFACVHNAGRSQMAAAFFNAGADPRSARAISAGTQPGDRVHESVVNAMLELGIDLRAAMPRLLTPELGAEASWLITMGCGDACPVISGVRRADWPLDDPMGQSLERVREIRDDIRQRVETKSPSGSSTHTGGTSRAARCFCRFASVNMVTGETIEEAATSFPTVLVRRGGRA